MYTEKNFPTARITMMKTQTPAAATAAIHVGHGVGMQLVFSPSPCAQSSDSIIAIIPTTRLSRTGKVLLLSCSQNQLLARLFVESSFLNAALSAPTTHLQLLLKLMPSQQLTGWVGL
jgi:hypothetical protein